MPTTIVLKNKNVAGSVPLPSNLIAGEVALNTADTKLFTLSPNGASVVQLAGAGCSSVTIQDAAPPIVVGGLWWDSTGLTLYIGYDDGTGTQWVPAATGSGGGKAVIIQDTAPTPVIANGLWWNSVDLSLYIGYNDGTSTQWVPATTAQLGSTAPVVVAAQTKLVAPSDSPNQVGAQRVAIIQFELGGSADLMFVSASVGKFYGNGASFMRFEVATSLYNTYTMRILSKVDPWGDTISTLYLYRSGNTCYIAVDFLGEPTDARVYVHNTTCSDVSFPWVEVNVTDWTLIGSVGGE